MDEAKRVMAQDGRFIAVDFETPWSPGSRIGALFARAIERTAGDTHYGNGRDFLRRGGLGAILRENGFVEVSRRDIATGSISVVVSRIDACSPREEASIRRPAQIGAGPMKSR